MRLFTNFFNSLRLRSVKWCKKMKILVAFDFDHTIIHFNSDIVVEKLVPKDLMTKELEIIKNGPNWLDYMQEIFNILHRNGITKDEILGVCADCESTEGMIDALKILKTVHKADIIIISDSNTVFIEHWLKSKKIIDLVDRVFTNPGEFNSDGLLEVTMYHEQDWCKLSTRNMCKGYILEKYLEEEKKKNNLYDVVAYVGDGRNDLCPILKLGTNDLCFPRVNYTLCKILKNKEDAKSQVKASIHPWNNGLDILNVFDKLCS